MSNIIYTKVDLEHFTGTELYHPDFLGINLTDGVAFVRDNFKCGWLISDIASMYNFDKGILKNRAEGNTFLIVTLKIDREKKTALLTFKEDSNTPILYSQKYEYSDIGEYFSDKELNFYLIDGVLLLPSEY